MSSTVGEFLFWACIGYVCTYLALQFLRGDFNE